ncbi:hypothetical protein O4H49_20155 [Kiloniella laminariae]|uniref:Conjugal transfer protein TrbI n=1 Tax=Kiloniella laminariae TaxID=454162 RepID=A0ABT4LPU9_9PROT|nr:TrbI/VirB10 family protein [Kiloniella laminariae]MCZ4283109.1 hypothetical protein [Kiloniella laminariae]
MYPTRKRLIALLALCLLLLGCDDDSQNTVAPEKPVDIPADYYTAPPKAEAPPPPVEGKLSVPVSFDMGRALVAEEFITRRIPVSIIGETPVSMFGIERSGNEDLTISSDCPLELAPGSSCTLLLEYLPQSPGELNSTILIATSKGIEKISVSGEGYEVAALPEPTPPPPVLPPAPKPPKPSPYEGAAYREAYALIERRRASGPSFASLKDDFVAVVPQEYKMTDSDYLREQTPSIETSFPVDRTNILTITRMHWGVLDREIVSSLPGLIIVRVDEDVFGTDGLTKILEKGDAYVGRYEPLEKVGDDRLNICFFRIIRLADGAHVYNSDECFAYATDAMGRVGLVGEVDNRAWEKYGSAFVTAGISALASYGTSKFDDGDGAVENSSEALSDQLGKITASMIEENIDLAPIITISGGERVGIQLLRDLYIRRPEPLKG